MVKSTNNEPARNNFALAYQALAPFDKIVLQVCSIIFEPTEKAVIQSCLKKSGLAGVIEEREFGPALATCLEKLHHLGFLNGHFQCDEQVVELVSREAFSDGHYDALAESVQTELSVDSGGENTWKKRRLRHLREIRIALYTSNIEHFNKHLIRYFDYEDSQDARNPVAQICNNPFDIEWFKTLPPQIQLYALHEIQKYSIAELGPFDLPLKYLQTQGRSRRNPKESRPSFYYLLIVQLLLHGDTKDARDAIRDAGNVIKAFGLTGWLYFIEGQTDKALKHFEKDLAQLRKINEKPDAYFTGLEGLFYILAIFKAGDFSRFEEIRSVIAALDLIQPHNIYRPAYNQLQLLVNYLESGSDTPPDQRVKITAKTNSIAALFRFLVQYWTQEGLAGNEKKLLASFFESARQNGYRWLAMEFAELLCRVGQEETYREYADAVRQETGLVSIISTIQEEESWLRALKALTGSASFNNSIFKDRAQDHRLAWFVKVMGEEFSITPKEQRLSTKGVWSKGRKLSLKKVATGERPTFFTDQDCRICDTLTRNDASRSANYFFDMEKALPLMTGHPYLFLHDDPSLSLELVKGEPELCVEKKEEWLHLELFPEISDEKFITVRETRTRYKLVEITEEHRRIARIIGPEGLQVPANAKEQVLAALGNISSHLTVHSAIGGIAAETTEIRADPRIYIHLVPVASGFRLAMYVKPLRKGGSYQKPGKGKKNLIAEIEGRRFQAIREFELEEENALKVENACSTLQDYEEEEREWLLQDPEDCLQVLLDLQALQDVITVEWPEGKKFAVSPQVSFDQLNIKIHKKNNWFEMNGQLELDDSLVLDMRKVLELVQRTTGRFVPLGHGQFLTLSRELRKRLDEITAYSDMRGSHIRFHPSTIPALKDFAENSGRIETDINWQEQINRIKSAQDLQPLEPSTLQAELRDYQIEGYIWLARLAHWGVGACLADDMGLGKTIQALAILLERAQKGPSLVVAPTSVCMNWLDEANRFAPTLNLVLFGGRNRKKLVENLKNFDVLVVSYGLLQQEAEALAGVEWQTIVLDEAQAIKNLSTKRSCSAMALTGKFKIITTGTPIENHLGELWNLFHFINPGLLGTLEQFNKRFAIPIERHGNHAARRSLKKLIQPFILRRIKSQVLEELPPRTEVLLQVEMSKKEAAFYEALRQQALEKLEHLNGPPGHRHLRILAEITRLRQACCNPRLVTENITIPSSKLNLFEEVTDELLGNRHKVLVFSQFVGHLTILREFLDNKGIAYKYLDGSTPPRQRRTQVEEFQAGEGDLFLISLKAGGLGLNLTAADYVIHMDPWWNPAVEDQASNRAHRIGQQHPVTIYRLVTKNTIEEKIVHLHREKRDLADSLLEGTDLSGKISTEELLELIREP